MKLARLWLRAVRRGWINPSLTGSLLGTWVFTMTDLSTNAQYERQMLTAQTALRSQWGPDIAFVVHREELPMRHEVRFTVEAHSSD